MENHLLGMETSSNMDVSQCKEKNRIQLQAGHLVDLSIGI